MWRVVENEDSMNGKKEIDVVIWKKGVAGRSE